MNPPEGKEPLVIEGHYVDPEKTVAMLLQEAPVKVTIDGVPGNVVTVPLADIAPAYFEIAPGVVAAVDPTNTANPVISAMNPAKRGKVISLYANGLGPVSNQPMPTQLRKHLGAIAASPAFDEQPITSVAQRETAPAMHRAEALPVAAFTARIAKRCGYLRCAHCSIRR